MRDLYIHIGAHRTATSSIQQFMGDNHKGLLERGFLYPFGVRRHFKLAQKMFAPDSNLDSISADLNNRADSKSQDVHSIVISDEDICTRKNIDTLSSLQDHFNVKIIYCLRRQDLWLESWYLQNIKWQWDKKLSHLTFDEFFETRKNYFWIDYNAYISKLERVFGQENIKLYVFERDQMPEGPITAFCKQIGLENPSELGGFPENNYSLSPITSEFMRCLPLDTADTQYRSLLETACNRMDVRLHQDLPKSGTHNNLLMTFEQRQMVAKVYKSGNAKIAKRYFGRDALFLDPLPDKNAELANSRLPQSSYELMQKMVGPFLEELIALSDPISIATVENSRDLRMVTLQNAIFPETEICTENELYFHTRGPAEYSVSESHIWLKPNSSLSFDTYFNALSIGKWHNECRLADLFLTVYGSGKFNLSVMLATSDKSRETLYSEEITLSDKSPHRADLSDFKNHSTNGIIYFDLTAISDGKITGAKYETRLDGKTLPKLAVSITTFNREEEVENTVARLSDVIRNSPFKENIGVFVVDNGQSADITSTDIVTYIPNANLGGAGGFARGLQEAEKAGYTHCLFMDDDASFHMENILRTYAFLALAKDPKTAVAGAMITNSNKWKMWENGSVFDRTCHPLFCGLDLRDRENIVQMETASSRHDDPKFYGGWWYFAFPIEAVEFYPFPFFVRGDDINFSLTNDFRINTLNGVVSFQDDFSGKESAQTLYLDLRNHLVQHLTVDSLKISATACASIPIWFLLRAGARFHYETAETLLLSWNDVMRGPFFFEANVDMAERRQTIKNIINNEQWRPVKQSDLVERVRYSAHDGTLRRFFRFALNGHLLPFYHLWGNQHVVGSNDRSNFSKAWGSSKLTYVNAAETEFYTVKQSKIRFFGLAARALWAYVRFVFIYNRLRKEYKSQHPKLASKAFWEDQALQHSEPLSKPKMPA